MIVNIPLFKGQTTYFLKELLVVSVASFIVKAKKSYFCPHRNLVAAKTIAAIIYHKASCHCFANYGYDKTKPGYLYLISLTKDTETFYKIGITCDTKRRFRELSNMNKLEINVLCIWEYPANSVILEHESFLKNHFGLGRSEENLLNMDILNL